MALRASPTARCRSYRGLTLRGVDRGLLSLRSGDALTPFGGGLRSAGDLLKGDIAIGRSPQAEPSSMSGRIESDAERERKGGASLILLVKNKPNMGSVSRISGHDVLEKQETLPLSRAVRRITNINRYFEKIRQNCPSDNGCQRPYNRGDFSDIFLPIPKGNRCQNASIGLFFSDEG